MRHTTDQTYLTTFQTYCSTVSTRDCDLRQQVTEIGWLSQYNKFAWVWNQLNIAGKVKKHKCLSIKLVMGLDDDEGIDEKVENGKAEFFYGH